MFPASASLLTCPINVLRGRDPVVFYLRPCPLLLFRRAVFTVSPIVFRLLRSFSPTRSVYISITFSPHSVNYLRTSSPVPHPQCFWRLSVGFILNTSATRTLQIYVLTRLFSTSMFDFSDANSFDFLLNVFQLLERTFHLL